jgi:colanic acid biosynthesis glycosyl transferase WcaI
MKILMISPNFSPELTGIGKYSGELAQWLTERGHQLEVFCTKPHYPMWEVDKNYRVSGYITEIRDGMTVRRIPCFIPKPDKVTTRNRLLMEFTFNFMSMRHWVPTLFRRNRFDMVLVVAPPFSTALFPILFCKLRRLPLITHVQDLQIDVALSLGMLRKNKLVQALLRIEKFIFEHSALVSTISCSMKAKIDSKRANSRTTLIPNWTDISSIYPRDTNTDLRSSLNLPANSYVCMYSGNLGEKQGLEIILRTAQFIRSSSQLHFVICGNGGSKSRLVELSRSLDLDNVTFLPLQPEERLNELLASADLHLVIQKTGTSDLVMPSKVTNILAAGRPILTNAEPGTELYEIVKLNSLGYVCENNEKDLANKILQATVEPKPFDLQQNCRRYAELNLVKDKILSDLEIELKGLL